MMASRAKGPVTLKDKNGRKRLLLVVVSLLQSYCFFPEAARSVQAVEPAAVSIRRAAPVKTGKKNRVPRGRQEKSKKKTLRGTASWYGPEFDGKKTASGEIFDQEKLTAAHKTLPLGSKAIVTNLKNGNSVEVEINDRGPYVARRVIDVSYAAAKELGLLESGLAPVRIELLHETG